MHIYIYICMYVFIYVYDKPSPWDRARSSLTCQRRPTHPTNAAAVALFPYSRRRCVAVATRLRPWVDGTVAPTVESGSDGLPWVFGWGVLSLSPRFLIAAVCVYVYVLTYVRMYVCMCVCVHVSMHTGKRTHLYAFICKEETCMMYVCVCIYTYIYI